MRTLKASPHANQITAVQSMKKMTVIRFLINSVLSIILCSAAFGQEPLQSTNNTTDQSLRSSGRVNPSSLGMEMSLPLEAYSTRGIGLPLNLSYSSKLWRLEEKTTVPQAYGGYKVWTNPRYSEESASGWTSSLTQPYIEYTGEKYRFEANGKPLSQNEVIPPGTPPHSGESYIKRITVFLPGGSHELRAQDAALSLANDQLPPASAWNTVFYAVDGSGLKYVQDSEATTPIYRLYMPDGSYYDFNSAREPKGSMDNTMVRYAHRLTDINGNYIAFNTATSTYPNGSWTDQLGRTFPVMVPRRTPAMPSGESVLTQTFNLPGMGAPYVLKWKKLKNTSAATSALTDFNEDLSYMADRTNGSTAVSYTPALFAGYTQEYQCAGQGAQTVYAANPDPDLFNPVVLTDIVLPTGATYRFSYNIYGEIERVNYPTGGYEAVTYDDVPSLAELTGLYTKANRGVVERNIYESGDDTTPETWTFSAARSKNNYRTSVLAPDGTQTDRFMHRGAPPPTCIQQTTGHYFGTKWGYDNALAGMAYEERVFSSGTPKQILQRTLTKWVASTTGTLMIFPSTYAQRNARAHSTVAIMYDGDAGLAAASKAEYDTDVDNLGSPQNMIASKEYAFSVVSGGNGFTASEAPPEAAVTITDPTVSATLVRTNETEFLNTNTSTDSVIVALRNACAVNNVLRVPLVSRIRNAAGTIVSQSKLGYDESGLGQSVGRGLRTSIRLWDSIKGSESSSSAYLLTTAKYDTYGNVIESTDARGNTTITTYDPTFSAFPVSVKTPVPDSYGTYGSQTELITSTTYNTVTGQPLTTTDANNQETGMVYDSDTRRLVSIEKPNGHLTIYEHGVPDSNGMLDASQRFVKVRSQITETDWSESYSWADGLGRPVRSQKISSKGDVFVDTEYDNMGRVKKLSNPYRAGETVLKTENFYDDLGRTIKVKTPDNAEVETVFGLATTGSQIGPAVTSEDQANKARRVIANAQGMLLRVDEPNGSNQLGTISSPNQPTYYTYDVMDNLTAVSQGGQSRSFVYDSLARITEATNPESGTSKYTYDANSNIKTRRDARGIKTIFDYDRLNRMTRKCYRVIGTGSLGATSCADAGSETVEPNTPDVSYYYDNLTNGRGRLRKVHTSLSTSETLGFDSVGNTTSHKQTTAGTEYPTSYVYNLSGGLIEETYPSTRTVKSILDEDGDMMAVQSRKNADGGYWNYAQNFTYSSAGAVTSMQLGNFRWESAAFNERLQPTQVALGSTQGATNVLKIDYSFGTTQNNGNLVSQTITVPETKDAQEFTAVQNYTYDSLNRLSVAEESIASQETWRQTFTYDRFGNRNFDEAATSTLTKNCGSSPNFTVCASDRKKENPSISASTNRVVQDQDGDSVNDYAFDAAGNTTLTAGGLTYIFDGEERQVEAKNASNQTIGQYYFDGDGRRIKKVVPATGEVTIFVYNAGGVLIAEYSTVLNPTQQVSYLTADNLGTPRINTDQSGAVIARHDYHPFGEEIVTPERSVESGYTADDVRKQFTGNERDDETGLDYAGARMYANWMGRFTAPDPMMGSGTAEEPQTWNRYAYVDNNPLTFVDNNGLLKRNKGVLDFTVTIPNWGWKNSGQSFEGMRGTLKMQNGGTIIADYNLNKNRLGDSNCHGLTFGDGEFSIDNSQVDLIVGGLNADGSQKNSGGDGYETVGADKAQEGDVVVYRQAVYAKKGDDKGQIIGWEVIHSATVTGTEGGVQVSGVNGTSNPSQTTSTSQADGATPTNTNPVTGNPAEVKTTIYTKPSMTAEERKKNVERAKKHDKNKTDRKNRQDRTKSFNKPMENTMPQSSLPNAVPQ